MLYRKITNYIESHLSSQASSVLVVDGARQVGKTYSIREVGRRLFPNFIEINMEKDRLFDQLFAEAKTVSDFYLALSTVAGDRMGTRLDTLVFIDEIQAYDHLLTLLKFLREDNRFTYIASGSLLGVTLRQTSSLPIGSISIKQMYPLDFEEFLIANGVGNEALDHLRKSFIKREGLSEVFHQKILGLFRKYLLVGGLPAAVNTFLSTQNIVEVRKVHESIHHLYGVDASRYEEQHKKLKIQRIYGMIPSTLENRKKRIVAKDIEEKSNKRMNSYAEEFDYLISSGITLDVKAISTPVFPLVESSTKNLLKLYLNDVGLLTNIYYRNQIKAVTDDVASVNLGSVYETVVAQELRAHGFPLYYYDNKKNGEVDFLIDDYANMSVLPIEVKSGKDYTVHSALSHFCSNKDHGVRQAFVFSNECRIFTKNSISYFPIYDVMFLQS